MLTGDPTVRFYGTTYMNHPDHRVAADVALDAVFPSAGTRLIFPELLEDWRRYGPDSFSFEILDVLPESDEPRADPKEELGVLESLWLERLQPYGEAGYNRPP